MSEKWRSGRQDTVSYSMLEGEDGGPWKNIYGEDSEDHPNRPGVKIPVAVARAYGRTEDDCLRRARLIAAAPDMADILRRLDSMGERFKSAFPETSAQIESVLAHLTALPLDQKTEREGNRG